MEGYQAMGHHGTRPAAPPAQRGTQALDPQPTSARIDRDSQLVDALRVGAATAADLLVATYGDRAYRLAIGITRNEQDAEEAVQDSFWSVVRKIDTFRGDSSFGSWIYRITANAAYQKLRGRARRRHEISLDEVLPPFHEDGRHAGPISDWSASIHDPAVQAELGAALASAIGELPVQYRAVIVLHDVEGLSMAEVAGSVGITKAAARSRTHRARLFLRRRLAKFMADLEAPTTS
jgi:RNA polymerase sigma-70 factor (ECF subfamily)